MSVVRAIINFIREAKIELNKVSWPTRATTVKYTLIVVAVSIVVAIFLGGLDYFFNYLISRFIL